MPTLHLYCIIIEFITSVILAMDLVNLLLTLLIPLIPFLIIGILVIRISFTQQKRIKQVTEENLNLQRRNAANIEQMVALQKETNHLLNLIISRRDEI